MADCGTCSLCCKLMAVPEISKPANQWCQHCKPGKGGCDIYSTRPEPCRDFQCGWLANDGDPELRPDRIHLVIGGESQVLNAYVVYVDPAYPEAPDKPLGKQLINALIESGRHPNVVLLTGNRPRRLVGKDTGIAARHLAKINGKESRHGA